MTTNKQFGLVGGLALLAVAGALAVWFAWPRPVPPVEQAEAPPPVPEPKPEPKPPLKSEPDKEEEAGEARRARFQKWLAQFQEQLKAADPVAVAIKALKNPHPDSALEVPIQVLVKHWEDPRSEATLTEFGKGQPKHQVLDHTAFPTLAGYAFKGLQEIRAKLD